MIGTALAFLLLTSGLSLKDPAQIKAAGGFEQLSSAAERARSENRDAEAIQLYKRALQLKPAWQEGQWYLSTLLYESNKYSEARDLLRRFVAQSPDAGPAWALLGVSEFETREYPRALEHLRRAMALGMGDREEMKQSVFYHAAVLFTRLEQYDDGLNMLLRMLGSTSDLETLVEPAGLAGLRIPLLPNEIPENERAMVRLAGQAVLATEGSEPEAKFKQLESSYPNQPGVHFLYGAYLMPIRPADGVKEMRRELEISPYNVLARVRLAEHDLQTQQTDDALSLAKDAVKFAPDVASAHMILGEVEIAKGDTAEGIKALEHARDIDPAVLRIHWDLLRAYMSTQKSEEAQREKSEIEKLMKAEGGKPPESSE